MSTGKWLRGATTELKNLNLASLCNNVDELSKQADKALRNAQAPSAPNLSLAERRDSDFGDYFSVRPKI